MDLYSVYDYHRPTGSLGKNSANGKRVDVGGGRAGKSAKNQTARGRNPGERIEGPRRGREEIMAKISQLQSNAANASLSRKALLKSRGTQKFPIQAASKPETTTKKVETKKNPAVPVIKDNPALPPVVATKGTKSANQAAATAKIPAAQAKSNDHKTPEAASISKKIPEGQSIVKDNNPQNSITHDKLKMAISEGVVNFTDLERKTLSKILG